jgi:hypothetical protein
MFRVVSRNFVAARHPLQKRVSGGVHTKHEFLPPEPILRFSQRTCPIHYFRSKTHVWGGFALYLCRTSPITKTGVGVHRKHEFLPLEPFLRFSQRTCPIHYFRSKNHAQFRCRTSPIPKTGVGVHTQHVFSPPEPFLRFSQRTCPIHYFRSKTHVWGGFALYHCRTSPIPKTGVGVHTKHEFLPPEPFLRFSQRTCPIHFFRSKTHVWCGFALFHCCTSPIPKTSVGVHTQHEFSPPEPFLRFSQRRCPIHYFRSKTHVWGGFAQFRCRTLPIPKTSVGVHTKHEFLPPEPFLRFSQRTCPIHCFRSKTHVWGGFAQFRCRTSPITNHFFAFCNEHAQSTTLDPKLMFGVVSRNFVAARHPLQKRVSGGVHTKH